MTSLFLTDGFDQRVRTEAECLPGGARLHHLLLIDHDPVRSLVN